jgi:hypothetical protein
VALPGTVLGESAILGLDGPPSKRTADVTALEPSVVNEFPIEVVKDGFAIGTPRLILRTLFGQICRNAILVLVAQPDRVVMDLILSGVMKTLSEAEGRFAGIQSWPDFMVTFRLLYSMREWSDGLRRELAPRVVMATEDLERAVDLMKSVFHDPGSIDYLKPFVESERLSRDAGEASS